MVTLLLVAKVHAVPFCTPKLDEKVGLSMIIILGIFIAINVGNLIFNILHLVYWSIKYCILRRRSKNLVLPLKLS